MTPPLRLSRPGANIPVRLAVLLFLAGSGAACSPQSNEEPKAAPAGPITEVTLNAEQVAHGGVRWSAVAASPVTDFVDVPGRLVLDEDHTARLSVSVRGRVTNVRANLGDAVSRRQVLVVLQSEEASARRAELAKASAEATERDSALRYARSARERTERLLALKAGSAQDVERARADEAAAEASAAQARASVEQARTALSVLEVDDTGQIQLAAPISGVVVARDVVVGSVVEAGASALAVADLAYLWLEFGAPDAVAGLLKPGQRLHFVVPPSSDTIEARVLRVNGAIDPTTRLVTVRAAVANPTKRLRPEMFVTVRADTTPSRPAVVVPHEAVQLVDERPVVFVAQPDGKGGATFVRRDVQTGATVDGRTHIVSGLSAGDVVVTAGAFAVKSQFSRGKMPAGG